MIMIVFAAIVPPSPLILPSVGKEHAQKLAQTQKAVDTLTHTLAACHAHACVLISQYGALDRRFGIGVSETYRGTLQSFGDLNEYAYTGAPALAQRLLAPLPHGMASAVTQPPLDHGSVVASRLLFPDTPLPLIPVHPSASSYESHLRFGAALSDPLLHCHERIALVAVGDLTHHASEASPEGCRPEGMLFDTAVLTSLKKLSLKHALHTAHKYEGEAQTSGMRAFFILLGILEEYHARFNLLSYEAPFGIGYLTAEYEI